MRVLPLTSPVGFAPRPEEIRASLKGPFKKSMLKLRALGEPRLSRLGGRVEIGAQVSVTRIRPTSLREVAFVFTHDAG
jgi:hypothetical protein